MARPLQARLEDILDALARIKRITAAHTAEEAAGHYMAPAAIERCLEIVSESSRHIPDDLKASCPDIPWRRVADLGNQLRHAYHNVDFALLWEICTQDLDAIEVAIRQMARSAPPPGR